MTFTKNDDGYLLWLAYEGCKTAFSQSYGDYIKEVAIVGESALLDSVASECSRALASLVGPDVPLQRLSSSSAYNTSVPSLLIGRFDDIAAMLPCFTRTALPAKDGFRIVSGKADACGRTIIIAGSTDSGTLYGVFSFLRILQRGEDISTLDVTDSPACPVRMLDHWDNLDGSIERGYAGKTLWKWGELPDRVDSRYTDYARAMASIGLNATVLNNVNTQPQILTTEYLRKVRAIADVFRSWGLVTYLSVNFGSPRFIGDLTTSDPCDPAVIKWWKDKTAEVYSLIPDFGGFLVKADSEGQPGPFAYGRSHADGANMLAEALAPFGGRVIWRAFVYGHGENDRAKKAYANFMPHDGEFRANVAVQVKNGAIDFQPREPVHPLFGAMRKTDVYMEFQIAQEYLGQGNHLVYLAPMWKEILDFDTHADGPGSTVNKYLAGIAAVSNTGNYANWCGSLFHPMNWYAFGRLCWNSSLSSEEIAREWILATWGNDPVTVETILDIMMRSWEACIDYMTPLCLHHIMKEGHHYGPDPAFDAGEREDWRCTYYHRADKKGLGFDRTRTGSAAVDQYYPPVADMFNDLKTCPEKYLLWFHHVPWNHILSTGKTLQDELVARYARGVAEAESMLQKWKTLESRIDHLRFRAVLDKLYIQVADAHEWHDVCVPYFMSFTR